MCDGRKGDIKTNSQEIYDTRLKIRERLRDIGLGSGALVQYETSGWVEDGGYVRKMTVGPLLDVDWDNVTQHDWYEHSYYGNSRSSLCQVYHTKPTVARATRGWAPSGPYKVNWPIEYEGGNSRDGTCIVSPSYAEYDDKWFTKVECNKTAMAVVDAEFNRKKKR